MSKLLDINIDLSRINIDLDVYLDILGGSASSSGGGGGLVSGLLDGILGRRERKAKAEEKAGEARERAQELRDRPRAGAWEKKERVLKKRYEARCGAVLAVPTAVSSAAPSATSTGAAPPPRPAKGNNRLSRPELPAGEVTETVVTVEEVSEEVVVEECILTCERASVEASVEAGEVRGCLGVTVRRRAGVDNCVYFVGGVEVVDLEVVLLIEEEVQGGRLGEEVDEDLRSDSFVPVGRVRRE